MQLIVLIDYTILTHRRIFFEELVELQLLLDHILADLHLQAKPGINYDCLHCCTSAVRLLTSIFQT